MLCYVIVENIKCKIQQIAHNEKCKANSIGLQAYVYNTSV